MSDSFDVGVMDYDALAKEQGVRGTSKAVALNHGLYGHVVPGATLLGAPPGFNPHKVTNPVHIEPSSKDGFVVDLNNIDRDEFNKAISSDEFLSISSEDELRKFALDTLRKVSTKKEPTEQVKVSPRDVKGSTEVTESKAEPPLGAEPAKKKQPAQADEQKAPVKSKVTAPHSSFFQTMKEKSKMDQPANNGSIVKPPTLKIKLEVEGFPMQIETYYHQVIRNKNTLALCYDTRYRGQARNVLHPTDKSIALHIEGQDVIFLLSDPDIKFEHNNEEIQVFRIEKECPITNEAESD